MSRQRRLIISSMAILALSSTFLAVAAWIRPAREITVAIDGDADQQVTATFMIDGQKREESLTTPANRTFHAGTLHFWIARNSDPNKPELSVKTMIDGRVFGAANAIESDQCVYGGVCTASLLRIRRERSYTNPAPQEIVAQLVTPPGFPLP